MHVFLVVVCASTHSLFLVRATYFQVNLSCNFFRGSFDICEYVAFVDAYWTHLEKLERAVQANGK